MRSFCLMSAHLIKLVFNETLMKTHNEETCRCQYSTDNRQRSYKDCLKPPHIHAVLIFEDRSSKVTKAKNRFGHGGSYNIKEVTFTCKQKTLMFGCACLVHGIWHWLSCLPGKFWIANPLKYSTEGFNCEIKWSSSDSKYGVTQSYDGWQH